jgi:oligoribonuclease NrnB/cAMP/cGMP phosphodiesterase (DHH superfamily)
MDIIYSHSHCPDGFVAAMIAKRRYPEAEVIFLDHGADHTENLKKAEGKRVLMLDFSLRTREENDALAASAKLLRILDHHKSAREVLEGASYATFDMTRSGAGLAWDYLFGYEDFRWGQWDDPLFIGKELSAPRPWYVNYVEDRDLWNWKLENSREVCAYLGTLEFEFEKWEFLDKIDPYTAFLRGTGAKAHIDHYVREAVKQVQFGELDGNFVGVLNVPYLNCSEIGMEIAKAAHIMANAITSAGSYSLTWFERGDGIIQFSLRSIGSFDVSAVAKKYGGGGHLNAAGFQVSLAEGRRLVDVILGREVKPTMLDLLPSVIENINGKCVK